MPVAVGVDAARAGWVAATPDGAVAVHARFTDVLALAGDAPVAVDMPIGLLDVVAPRPCDRAARRLLGRRASTVFTPPSRPVLAARTYAEARTQVPGAASLSAQAFGLAPRIRELDDLLRGDLALAGRVVECHPELAFLRLAGVPLASKHTPQGVEQRRALLPHAPGAQHDVLDACAVLGTALRIAAGAPVTTLGGERDAAGLPMRIVY